MVLVAARGADNGGGLLGVASTSRGSWETREVHNWDRESREEMDRKMLTWWCKQKPSSVLCSGKRAEQLDRSRVDKKAKVDDTHQMYEGWCAMTWVHKESPGCVAFSRNPAHRNYHGMRARTIDNSPPVKKRRRGAAGLLRGGSRR